jgi:type I site-specific restriction endonuclease
MLDLFGKQEQEEYLTKIDNASLGVVKMVLDSDRKVNNCKYVNWLSKVTDRPVFIYKSNKKLVYIIDKKTGLSILEQGYKTQKELKSVLLENIETIEHNLSKEEVKQKLIELEQEFNKLERMEIKI